MALANDQGDISEKVITVPKCPQVPGNLEHAPLAHGNMESVVEDIQVRGIGRLDILRASGWQPATAPSDPFDDLRREACQDGQSPLAPFQTSPIVEIQWRAECKKAIRP